MSRLTARGGISKRMSILLLLVAVAFPLSPVAEAAALPNAAAQHQLVPAYFYPNGFDAAGNPSAGNKWGICRNMKSASIAIMNPASGPGVGADANYRKAIAFCQRNKANGKQKVIGYVSTRYGTRTLAAVNADIDTYYRNYPSIDGIFVDEIPNCNTCVYENGMSVPFYYNRVYRHVKTVSGNVGRVVGNPGAAASTPWQLDTPIADIVVVFEGTRATYATWTPPAWVKTRSSDRISQLVYSTSSNTRPSVCAKTRANNAGWYYVTDDAMPNPWDALPTYLTSVAPNCLG